MKVAIIVPYFGKLPNYFQLFLDSCKKNEGFEWIIFSDDTAKFNYPSNVHLYKMSFEECKEIIQSKFDFMIALQKSNKLCDYKCAYGFVFQEYLQGYDWWGHCDLDQIFGDLSKFITEEMLGKYQKLFSLGHLTLYRNNFMNNRLFMSPINGRERYKEVFMTDSGCGFDEWLPDNINDIYLKNEPLIMLKNMGADINPYKMTFSLVEYNITKGCYVNDKIKNSVFKWEDGCIYQEYMKNGILRRKEFPYVHLQKRKMIDIRKNTRLSSYYIIPNMFVDGDLEAEKLLRKCLKWKLFNVQFFKVKYDSLKKRLKSGDWKFSNVFR